MPWRAARARRIRAPGRWPGGLLGEDRQEAGVFLLPLRRQRPLLPQALLELVAEEAVLHAAVDDVPGQYGVGRTIAEDEEVGVYACFGDGGAPVAAVAFGGLDRRRDAAVTERQQGLVERMPFRLDVEVDVVDVGDQAAHALDLP